MGGQHFKKTYGRLKRLVPGLEPDPMLNHCLKECLVGKRLEVELQWNYEIVYHLAFANVNIYYYNYLFFYFNLFLKYMVMRKFYGWSRLSEELKSETAFPLWMAMEILWKRNDISNGSFCNGWDPFCRFLQLVQWLLKEPAVSIAIGANSCVAVKLAYLVILLAAALFLLPLLVMTCRVYVNQQMCPW